MRKGFTLLELIIVIIIIGVLASLGFTQYTRVVERGRTAEAKAILGTIRTAEQAYYLEQGSYTSTIGNLAVNASTACNGQTAYYFAYSVTGSTTDFTGTATRCTGTEGKTPGFAGIAYVINITQDGTWGGTQGYY